jgi:hypothetical protein
LVFRSPGHPLHAATLLPNIPTLTPDTFLRRALLSQCSSAAQKRRKPFTLNAICHGNLYGGIKIKYYFYLYYSCFFCLDTILAASQYCINII